MHVFVAIKFAELFGK